MGIYLNPGNKNFRRITNADIYVDKTMMISSLNRYIDKGNTNVCFTSAPLWQNLCRKYVNCLLFKRL